MAATAQDASAPLRGPDKKDEDRDEDTEYSPFFGIEKGAVLQEARIFNESHINARQCQQVITKLLYLLCQGETFSKKEASEVFFSVTKLFQNRDANLRRMVYLVIKDVCPSADEVIIITSSLMKDMNSKTDLYRSNAIRVLCSITDTQLLAQIERYLKQAVVDKSAVVASAVLVSAFHLVSHSTEIVKRWTNEIQEAVQSKHSMVQFHAVALLHALRANDRLAVSKLVSSLVKGSVRSTLAQVLLVRYVAQVIQESGPRQPGETGSFYDFLESCLRHKNDMVTVEAARAICNMKEVTTRELTPAVTVLQLMLSSSKPVIRFAAVRTLNKVAMSHPMSVTNCNIDMESLISDQNRSIATLAITTLLKTGNESSVDRLLKQIGTFMTDIADEFKIVVVEAIRSLCLKFPQKYRALMNFLSGVLREDGGFEYKKAIVDSILILIREIPDAKESGLAHLCEFIEDCEFTYLSTQVLHLLGMEGPRTKEPAKYIRYIYNRVILENATVRAAAVSSLAQFGALVEDLRPRIQVLLKRALHDNDDEVRDRATLYLSQLEGGGSGEEAVQPQWDVPFKNLEASLRAYLQNGAQHAFDLRSVAREVPESPGHAKKLAKEAKKGRDAGLPAAAARAPKASEYADQLKKVPQFAKYGQLFKSSEPVQLTEEETEYNIVVIKHVFPNHTVLQFQCTNTVQEQVLEDVSVSVDLSDALQQKQGVAHMVQEGFEEEAVLPLARMVYGEVGHSYVALARPEGATLVGKFTNVLKFTVKEIDPTSGEEEEDGYSDEYTLEDLEVGTSDYVKQEGVADFRSAWEEMDESTELADSYGLGHRDSMQEAVEAVIAILGMQVCEGTDAVAPNARSHSALLSGIFIGDATSLVRLKFGIEASTREVAMHVTVRSDTLDVSELVHQIIQDA